MGMLWEQRRQFNQEPERDQPGMRASSGAWHLRRPTRRGWRPWHAAAPSACCACAWLVSSTATDRLCA